MPSLEHPWRLGSSLRCCDARQTLARAEPLMDRLGISRVTDITRMDRLGLPVYASVRPRSRTLRVHAGKGLLAVDARVGALMEAIEYAVAEPQATSWPGRRAALGGLLDELPGRLKLGDLAPRRRVSHDPGRIVDAVRCDDLDGGAPVWLPAELVFVPLEPGAEGALFGWSTNGLASGNSLEEASLHGLLEVLERDAVTMNLPRDESRRVEPCSLPEPFRSLARDWRALGVALSVRMLPNAFGLPCFRAWLHDEESTDVDLADGIGLHLCRDIALARAICEAAQSRLSHIHGGRDDIVGFYDAAATQSRRDAMPAEIASIFDATQSVRFDDVPEVDTAGRSIAELLDELLVGLRQRGFAQVFRHHFGAELAGLHVVKVVVPRCEEFDSAVERVGTRLRNRVVSCA